MPTKISPNPARDGHVSAPEPAESNGYRSELAAVILRCHRRLTGRDLLPGDLPGLPVARALYEAPFVVLAHDTAADPLFTYANLTAQRLFEMPWREIVGMSSRYSAEPLLREERQRLLERVSRNGYIDDYQGVRISRTGRRFLVRNATVWNLSDDDGSPLGQAATFAEWTPIDSNNLMNDDPSCRPRSGPDLSHVTVAKLAPPAPLKDYLEAMKVANAEATSRLGDYMLLSWYDRDRDFESPQHSSECHTAGAAPGYVDYGLNHGATLMVDIEGGRFVFFYFALE